MALGRIDDVPYKRYGEDPSPGKLRMRKACKRCSKSIRKFCYGLRLMSSGPLERVPPRPKHGPKTASHVDDGIMEKI